MKKTVALLTVLAVLMLALNIAVAESSSLLQWHPEVLDIHFPKAIVQDQQYVRDQWYGTDVNCLGLLCTGGANLRSYPTTESIVYIDQHGDQNTMHPTIIAKLTRNETVYVNFKCYCNGYEWYYVTRSDGYVGFVSAKRILLFPGR